MSGDFVCFLEERSAQELLRVIIPKVITIDHNNIKFISFEGKNDLDKNIERKIAFYRVPHSVFLVMRDQDSENCTEVKQRLLGKIGAAKRGRVKVRIACRELESFYLGDLSAVEHGLEMRGLTKKATTRPFRNIDDHITPSHTLEQMTKNRYQKIAGSRSIAPHLKLDNTNRSRSFCALLQAIRDLHRVYQASS